MNVLEGAGADGDRGVEVCGGIVNAVVRRAELGDNRTSNAWMSNDSCLGRLVDDAKCGVDARWVGLMLADQWHPKAAVDGDLGPPREQCCEIWTRVSRLLGCMCQHAQA